MNDFQIEIGQNLRALRKEAKLSQQQVGKMMNMTSQAIANYENGKRDISSSMLLQFAKIFNVSVSSLIGAPQDDSLPSNFWDKLVTTNAKLEEELNRDFDIHVVGNIPQEAFDELMSFIDYLKHKYGFPKK